MSDLVPRRRQEPPSQARLDRPREHPPYGDAHPLDDEIELRDLFGVLRRRIGLFVLMVLLALGGTGLFIWLDQPSYQATAVIQIEDARRGLTGGLDGAAAERMTGQRTLDPVRSHLEVLRSASVLGEVVDREGLRFRPLNTGLTLGDFDGAHVLPDAPVYTLELRFEAEGVVVQSREGVAEAAYGQEVSLGGVRFVVPQRPDLERGEVAILHRQQAIEALNGNLRVNPREGTDIADVEFTSSDPEVAQRVANAVVEIFRDHNARQARQQAQRRRAFIEEQLEQADTMLAGAQRTLSDFRQRERVFSTREWFSAQQTGLLTMEMRREELQADRGMYRSLLDGIQEAGTGEISDRLEAVVASPEIAQNPVVENLFGQLVRYEAARDSLVSGPWGASATNPDVTRIEEQLRSTTARLESAVRSHLRTLDARIAALDDLHQRTQEQIEALPEIEAEEARLVQQVESIQRTVDQLREELQRARISEAVEVGQVEVVDFAPLPLGPEGAGRGLKLALGLMLGLMLGAGATFMAEALDTRIRGREDAEESLQVPSLGVIPRMATGGNGAAAQRLTGVLRKAGLPVRASRRTLGDGSSGSELVTLTDSGSSSAEAFRTLRTNLLFTDAPEGIQTLVVTSALPEDGKTVTASNLAVTYAQQGIRVLLIDCDLRRGRISELFAIPRTPGLSELVLERAELEETVRECTAVENLWLLPTGTLPPGPTELLGGARMRKALERLSERYDLVILDTPPLAAGADAAILGAAADGVVLVVRAGRTDREAGQQAVRQLDTVGARVLGAVVNDPDGEGVKYAGYYAYEYGYGKY